MTTEIPTTPEQLLFRQFLHGLMRGTVRNAFDAWELAQDGALTIKRYPGMETIDPEDDTYDGWTVCRIDTTTQSDLCAAFPDEGHDVTLIAYDGACPSTGSSAQVEFVSCPNCIRLYPSGHQPGDDATTESNNAPDLGPSHADPDWDVNDLDYRMMYAVPAGSVGGGGSGASWSAVGAAIASVAVEGYIIRLGSVAGLLEVIQAGGAAWMQMRARSRSGVGINEGAQDNYAKWSGRIYRPSTSSFVAQLWEVGDFTGSAKFPAQSTPDNRSWSADRAAYAEAESSDYLVIDVGTQHNGPVTGGTGVSLFTNDSADSDLPVGDGASDNLRAWVELCD